MDVKTQAQLNFYGVDFVHINFVSEQNVLEGTDIKLDLKIDPKVFHPKDQPTMFNITMEVIVSVPGYFNLSLFAIGKFEIIGEIIDEMKKGFINTNAPAIMFPYVRAFISTFTSVIGSPTGGTLTIPPHFFAGKLEELVDNLK